MGSWLGWLLIVAGVYLVVIVVRAIIQLVTWFIEVFFPTSWTQAPSHKQYERRQRTGESAGTSKPGIHARTGHARWILASAAQIALIHWLAAAAEFVQMLIFRRRFDYWVGLALAEGDDRKKVKYLSKALALNPGYMPGWGMLAKSLLALERYRESLECWEKILKTAPNLFAWYEKGYCCYHLGQFQEALQCFDKVLAECSDKESTLREDVALHRKIVEAMLDRQALGMNTKAQTDAIPITRSLT